MLSLKFSPSFLKNIHLGLLLAGVTLFFILLALLSFINTGRFFSNWELSAMLKEGWLILIQMIVTMYFVYYTIRFFDKKYEGVFFLKRYIYELFFIVVTGFAINNIFHSIFIKLVVVPEANLEDLNIKLHHLLIVSQVLILISYMLITGIRILGSLQQKQLEIIILQKKFAQTQFETLKNQLNPHFLFNSLSILASLVYTDADEAEIFIEKLSGTYRYLLDHRENEPVYFSKEIKFLENYQYIINMRYGKKLLITREDNANTSGSYLLPHTFLIILEFIIGGNSISESSPLSIHICTRNQLLLIKYGVKPKVLQTVQLLDSFNSLCSHYHQLGKEITITMDEFQQQKIIIIPLLTT
jgi:hypothetical protein